MTAIALKLYLENARKVFLRNENMITLYRLISHVYNTYVYKLYILYYSQTRILMNIFFRE